MALVGARDLDPAERDFIRESGIHTGKHAIERALSGADGVYVAIDADGLDEAEVASFMPVAGGVPLAAGRAAAARGRTRAAWSSAPACRACFRNRRTSSR